MIATADQRQKLFDLIEEAAKTISRCERQLIALDKQDAGIERPVVCYGYARQSNQPHHHDPDAGHSISSQKQKIEEHFKRHYQPQGYVWGGVYVDANVSGADEYQGGVPFCMREAGGALNRVVQRGDVVIISSVNRAFRSNRDQAQVTSNWAARGISTVYLDLGADANTTAGKMMTGFSAIVAEQEHTRICEQRRDRSVQAIQKIQPNGRPSLWSFKFIYDGSKPPGKRYTLVEDEQQRHWLRLIWQWYTEDGLNFREIFERLRKLKATKYLRLGKGKVKLTQWSYWSVWDNYKECERNMELYGKILLSVEEIEQIRKKDREELTEEEFLTRHTRIRYRKERTTPRNS